MKNNQNLKKSKITGAYCTGFEKIAMQETVNKIF
jgi:hypothetical protein